MREVVGMPPWVWRCWGVLLIDHRVGGGVSWHWLGASPLADPKRIASQYLRKIEGVFAVLDRVIWIQKVLDVLRLAGFSDQRGNA
jgi:hypothetical protein